MSPPALPFKQTDNSDAPRAKGCFSSKANPQQLTAIQATEGPLLIIAGPGSGKTFTLVERIVYLILEKAIRPESLFVVTFTDKAAQELTTRISSRLTELDISLNLNELYLGTFHSIGLRLLEDHREYTRLKRNFTLMDQFDQQYFLYQNLAEYQAIPGSEDLLGEPQRSAWDQSESLLKWLNKATEEALDTEALSVAPEALVRTLGALLKLYRAQLKEHNALDFSNIQYEALRLLQEHPGVMHKLRDQITYLVVDEYQDTNTINPLYLKH